MFVSINVTIRSKMAAVITQRAFSALFVRSGLSIPATRNYILRAATAQFVVPVRQLRDTPGRPRKRSVEQQNTATPRDEHEEINQVEDIPRRPKEKVNKAVRKSLPGTDQAHDSLTYQSETRSRQLDNDFTTATETEVISSENIQGISSRALSESLEKKKKVSKRALKAAANVEIERDSRSLDESDHSNAAAPNEFLENSWSWVPPRGSELGDTASDVVIPVIEK